MTPTQRTLKHYRDLGYIAEVSEKWIAIPRHPAKGVRKDLFGFVDVVAVGHGKIMAVQATSGSNVTARVVKIKTECRDAAMEWLKSGGSIRVVGWRKLKKKVDGKNWQPKIVVVTLEDFA